MIFDRWTYEARGVAVHDADTIRAEIDLGFEVRVTWSLRLLGIQAPEVSGAGVTPEEREAGLAARDVLRGLLLTPIGKVYVRTVRDKAEGRGRYLATVFLEQGLDTWDVNALLVREGHAVAYDGKGKAPRWTPAGWRPAS